MLMTFPRWTVTARLQASGQSSGQAVSTIVAGPPRTGSGIDRTIAFLSAAFHDCGEAPRAARRPPGKAQGARISGICERRATQPGGMHRRPNATAIMKVSTEVSGGSTRSPQAPHVVIIGGGFGGLFAARAFQGAAVRVTLIDRHNYHLFQPLLYQVATASLSPGDIASPIRWVLRKQKNVQVLLAAARAIDAANRRVIVDSGPSDEPLAPIAYDYLIVAAGATHSYFGHGEWEA